MIPQAIIDQLLDELDIVEVISEYIPLKKAGANFKTNCPFHNEKTPSFTVSAEKQIYHCFGCGAGGNVIGFLMQYEKLTFPEAVDILAKRVGIELPKYKPEDKNEVSINAKLYKLNDIAATFYQKYLMSEMGKPALDYLKERGISAETISEFRIGFAPDEWEGLKKYCERKKIPMSFLRQAGLVLPGEKNRGDYDRFRKRIMFPIFNDSGKVVAFGGRVLDDSLPKYINSPECPVYSKSNILYGLNFCKKSIREKGFAVIVEGYMDVVIPFQFGITNLIATSGTALTERQASLLKRQTDTACILFDSDQAGEAASLRGLDVLIEKGMRINVSTLPQGEDPASFVIKHGKEKFDEVVENAKDLFDYKLDILIRKFGKKDIGSITKEMLPTISKVENLVLQSNYLRELAGRLNVHEASLRYELGRVRPDYGYRKEVESDDGEILEYRKAEKHLLGLAIINRKIFDKIIEKIRLNDFRDVYIRKAMEMVGECYASGEDNINVGKVLGRIKDDRNVKNAVIQAVTETEMTVDPEKALADCFVSVRKENRDETLRSLKMQLKEAEKLRDDEKIMELVKQINKIHKEKVIKYAEKEAKTDT